MMECVDGEYQNFKAKGGAYTREHFFGKYPELKEMVANMSDDDIWRLNRGGHDPRKVYNAYQAAVTHKDQPTVILAKTVKGYRHGRARAKARTSRTSRRSWTTRRCKAFRDRFNIPVSDAGHRRTCRITARRTTARSSQYLHERRKSLGGYLPSRRTDAPPLAGARPRRVRAAARGAAANARFSTTMALRADAVASW